MGPKEPTSGGFKNDSLTTDQNKIQKIHVQVYLGILHLGLGTWPYYSVHKHSSNSIYAAGLPGDCNRKMPNFVLD